MSIDGALAHHPILVGAMSQLPQSLTTVRKMVVCIFTRGHNEGVWQIFYGITSARPPDFGSTCQHAGLFVLF